MKAIEVEANSDKFQSNLPLLEPMPVTVSRAVTQDDNGKLLVLIGAVGLTLPIAPTMTRDMSFSVVVRNTPVSANLIASTPPNNIYDTTGRADVSGVSFVNNLSRVDCFFKLTENKWYASRDNQLTAAQINTIFASTVFTPYGIRPAIVSGGQPEGTLTRIGPQQYAVHNGSDYANPLLNLKSNIRFSRTIFSGDIAPGIQAFQLGYFIVDQTDVLENMIWDIIGKVNMHFSGMPGGVKPDGFIKLLFNFNLDPADGTSGFNIDIGFGVTGEERSVWIKLLTVDADPAIGVIANAEQPTSFVMHHNAGSALLGTTPGVTVESAFLNASVPNLVQVWILIETIVASVTTDIQISGSLNFHSAPAF